MTHPSVKLAVRSSEGLFLRDGPNLQSSISLDDSKSCRVMTFSSEGSLLSWCNGESVKVIDLKTQTVKSTISKPRTRHMTFSPLGTYLCLWEPYAIYNDEKTGRPNMEVWKGDEKVAEYIQKKTQSWVPQWSDDETLCARNVTNEVHCFQGGTPGRSVDHKLQIANLELFAISPGKPPYKIAVYVRGSRGGPSFVRLYEYPRLDQSAIVASKSFFRADTVDFHWNKKGSAVLVLTTTEVDKSGASYYGEQGLHYLSSKGEGNIVILSKKGPVYEVEWSPDSTEFCVLYGFMPSKATLFNCKCEALFEFGTGHRNLARYNRQGNILCLAGFGNLRGNMELWDRKNLKLITKTQASDSTSYEWNPDGTHFVTATTAPRLREGNGYKFWHFSGSLITQYDMPPPKQELWEVLWQPCCLVDAFPPPDVTDRPSAMVAEQPKSQVKQAAYRPPGLRGKPYTYKLHEEEKPHSVAVGGVSGASEENSSQKISKSALKNKRKRENKQKGKEESTATAPTERRNLEQRDALEVASYIMSSGGGGGASKIAVNSGSSAGTDKEKLIKNLRKKLKQIEQLKTHQSEGKELQANQIEKIKSEHSILEEIAKLDI